MKNQFLFFAATFIAVAFVSCSKEKIEVVDVPVATNEEIATGFSGGGRPGPKLEARFEFDGNLKEIAGRVPAGISTTIYGAAKYRKDRKGNEHRALLFDESYGVNLFDIPQQTNTSLSAWLFVEPVLPVSNWYPNVKVVSGIGPTIAYSFSPPFWLDPPAYFFNGGVTLPNLTASGDLEKGVWEDGWHHVVVTYDGNTIRLYLDGNLVDSTSFEGEIRSSRQDYKLGFTTFQYYFWKGALDDLRFYSGTLSASDVQKLYNF